LKSQNRFKACKKTFLATFKNDFKMASNDIVDPVLDLGMLENSPAWKLASRFLVIKKFTIIYSYIS